MRDILLVLVTGFFGAVYTFTPYKLIKSYGLGFGLRHNDHVFLGIIFIIVAVVLVYKIMIRDLLR